MVTTPDAPVQTWTLSRLLITASRLVEHHIAEQLRPYHLTHASFGVLALVSRGPISQRELAHATRVEEQTISQSVDRLERLGMVTREKDPTDRRRFLVTMTDAGREAFRQATRHDHAEQGPDHAGAIGPDPRASGSHRKRRDQDTPVSQRHRFNS